MDQWERRGIYLSLVGSKEASDVGIVVGGFFFRASNERWTLAEMNQWERRDFNLPLAGEEQGSERCKDSSWAEATGDSLKHEKYSYREPVTT